MSDHFDTLMVPGHLRDDLDCDRAAEVTLDETELARQVATLVENTPALDGSVADPAGHVSDVAARLFPTTLSFGLGSRAAFASTDALDDAVDVIRSLLTGPA